MASDERLERLGLLHLRDDPAALKEKLTEELAKSQKNAEEQERQRLAIQATYQARMRASPTSPAHEETNETPGTEESPDQDCTTATRNGEIARTNDGSVK